MRSKFGKFITIFMLLVMVAGVLQACAPAAETAVEEPAAEEPMEEEAMEESAIEPGELEVGVLWEEGSPSFDLVKSVGDSLEKDFPGTKVIYTFNNTAARPQIETRMMAGDPLDIDFIFEGMDPNSYSWVEGDYIMDITEYLNETREDGTTWKDDINPLFYPSMMYEGKFYGVPDQVFIWALHYNKGMFDEMGLTPPTTWEELINVSDQILEKSDGEVAPIATTGQVNFYAGMWFDSLVQRTCGTEKVMEVLYGDSGAKLSDDPCFLQAAEEMNKLEDNGYLIEGWEATDFTTSQVFFFQEKAAMILMGSWLMTEMKDSIPEGYELGVAPFVSVEGGAGDQGAVFGRALSWNIPAQTDVPELAVEFMRRFSSDEVAQKRVNELGAISPNMHVPAPSAIAGADELLANASSAEFILYNYGVNTAKFGLASAWYDPMVEMWLGDLTPEETLEKIDASIEAVRNQRATEAE
ncbi:MAG: extracellular solute-binding protein [Anaerolineaceae bacterium]|nr:extracellular solute-binding protein [Anaerolineaceae bacterium]